MAFVPVEDIAQATIFYEDVNGVLAVNRLYVGNPDPQTVESLQEIGDVIHDIWDAQVTENMTQNWQVTGITIRAMNEAEGLQVVHDGDYPIEGGFDATDMTPNQVSYTVTLNTGLVGRSARGRVYGVGLPDSYCTGTRLTDAGQGFLDASWGLVRLALQTAGHALAVVSFQEGGVPRPSGRSIPVLSTSVRFPLATQRRRLS